VEVPVSQLARAVATVAVIALGVPIALFAGVNLTCAGSGMSPSCAGDGMLLSPFLLLVTGIIAAFLARGWSGFLLGALGIVIGMALLWIIAAIRGTMIPIDPAQAVVATIWFGLPSVIGYTIARVAMWAVARARGQGPSADAESSFKEMGEGI
jgi:hypothetical protein